LFHRDETKIASFARGKSDAVSRPRTDGIGRIPVGGYVKRLYLCMLSIYSVTYLYGYHQPYAQSCSSEWLFLFLVLIHSTPLIIASGFVDDFIVSFSAM